MNNTILIGGYNLLIYKKEKKIQDITRNTPFEVVTGLMNALPTLCTDELLFVEIFLIVLR